MYRWLKQNSYLAHFEEKMLRRWPFALMISDDFLADFCNLSLQMIFSLRLETLTNPSHSCSKIEVKFAHSSMAVLIQMKCFIFLLMFSFGLICCFHFCHERIPPKCIPIELFRIYHVKSRCGWNGSLNTVKWRQEWLIVICPRQNNNNSYLQQWLELELTISILKMTLRKCLFSVLLNDYSYYWAYLLTTYIDHCQGGEKVDWWRKSVFT